LPSLGDRRRPSVRRKLFQRSSPKLLGQYEPNFLANNSKTVIDIENLS